ncbi:MAG: class I SAM-dependent methyltransferase [Gammaproteobacteria bacterium]|nr:class I SAM-dependent methyltransferase [Gammaproteobacteria bacterium]
MKNLLVIMATLLVTLVSPAASALDKEALHKALTGIDRDPNDLLRDEVRKPVEVLDFLGVEEGMSVLDVYAAGGYYTFILAKAVGNSGVVYAQNTEQGLGFQEGRQNISMGDAFNTKISKGTFNNVNHILAPIGQLGIPEESLDMILLSQIFHDFYNSTPERALAILTQLKTLLKPNGVIGIIDHVGIDGQDNHHMHRMLKQEAIDSAREAGFTNIMDSDLLNNEADKHERHVFHPSLNRNTDRFLLKIQNGE